MKTQINLFDHASGLRDTIVVPISRDEVVQRLRRIIGEPQFEIFDEDFAMYMRIDIGPIIIHVFSYSADAAAAAWNEIVGTLQRRAIA